MNFEGWEKAYFLLCDEAFECILANEAHRLRCVEKEQVLEEAILTIVMQADKFWAAPYKPKALRLLLSLNARKELLN